MMSNADVYLAIAEEALSQSEKFQTAARTPKPDGSPGFVIKYDPDQRSFKQSLIAIIFSGVYLDALLYIVGIERLGRTNYQTIDREHYEAKLEHLGATDKDLLASCKRFRNARNDLVHEKALAINEPNAEPFYTAQEEAVHAVQFVKRVANVLRAAP
jgi:hypothetical protein